MVETIIGMGSGHRLVLGSRIAGAATESKTVKRSSEITT